MVEAGKNLDIWHHGYDVPGFWKRLPKTIVSSSLICKLVYESESNVKKKNGNHLRVGWTTYVT